MVVKTVSIAPLVLLSVVDHYKRLSTPRVVGVLLGSTDGSRITVTNSFAIPFEEAEEQFFFDTSYLQNMFDLHYKVNCKEQIVGWYHSGPRLCKSDLSITEAMSQYTKAPILAVVNVHVGNGEIPCQVFRLGQDRDLIHMNVRIGADETEEVGVEHLLRDIKEGTGCSIRDRVSEVVNSLKAYEASLGTIIEYLQSLEDGKKPNKKILDLLQDILNNVPRYQQQGDMSKIYVSELVSTFIAMNDLEKNKLERKQW